MADDRIKWLAAEISGLKAAQLEAREKAIEQEKAAEQLRTTAGEYRAEARRSHELRYTLRRNAQILEIIATKKTNKAEEWYTVVFSNQQLIDLYREQLCQLRNPGCDDSIIEHVS